MTSRSMKLKDFKLFDASAASKAGNTVKPQNDFIQFKKDDINQSVAARFEQQTAIYGHKTAVVCEDQFLTYDALNREANRTAYTVLEAYDDRFRLNENEKSRYRRQMMLHNWGVEAQERLKRTTVFAAGAGGSGSPLIMQLALAGFGTIIVCDFDEVELSNLNRQVLHDESRIDMNKAVSAAKSIRRINPNVRVICYTEKITRENIHQMVGDAEVIFDNVDDMEAKFVLSQCAVEKGIPHVISSMIDMNAYAAIFHTPHTPCFHCLYDRGVLKEMAELKALVEDYHKNPNPVVSPPLFLSTGFAVNEVIKILLGFDKEKSAYNKYFVFNQRGADIIAETDGYRQITYSFSRHFREISRQQGYDWDQGWQGRFLDEIEITPDAHCPVCGGGERLEPLPREESEAKIEPALVEEPLSESAPPQTVALLFEHGIDMIVGILGTLKSGKVYVPLDPGYPVERLDYMLEDSGARLIITNEKNYNLAIQLRDRVNKHIAVVDITRLIKNGEKSTGNPGIHITPDQLAYILYTSGSTGEPKGVMQNQRNVLHFARVYANALHIHPGDRLTLFSSYGFDAAKMDIYGALLNGGTLYPYDIKKEGNLYRMARWLQMENITIYHSIPTVYRYFADMLTGEERMDFLRFIVLGGEAVFKKDVETYKKFFSDECLFINGLGPTESTVTLQFFIDKNTELKREAVSVGYPVDETEILLLDEQGHVVEGYGVGEIVYKSEYLALGYLNKGEKTAQAFVTDPVSGRGRVYRSGDLGRRLRDGSIEYVGRKDFQVKIRGYRVELGEIEGRLDGFPGIKKSVVVCRKDTDGENYLTAYYVESGDENVEINEDELAERLKAAIPDYMVPGSFYRLEEFPLTATGKIDRKTLAETTSSQSRSMKEYIAPSPGVESSLAELWKELLKVEKVGVYDNFFVLGGNSLRAIMLTSLVQKHLEVKVPLMEVFKNPTIRQLAEYINRTEKSEFIAIKAAEKKDYYVMSSAQKRLFVLQQNEPESITYNMSTLLELSGPLDREKMEFCFRRLIQRHESLRTSFEIIRSEPVQRIHSQVEFMIESHEASAQDGIETIVNRFMRPFDLSRAPLIRVGFIKLARNHHILMADIHHIVSDGLSHQILEKEFNDLYNGKELRPLKLQYKDFAEWHNTRVLSGEISKQKEYWLKEFSGAVPVLKLPLDYPRTAGQGNEGESVEYHLSEEYADRLRAFAASEEVTIFTLALALYYVLLAKLSGQEDIVVGTVIAGRRHADIELLMGMFVNTLALRNYPAGDLSFSEFLAIVKQRTLEAFENQDFQFEDLVENVVVNRDINRNPVFDILFTFVTRDIPVVVKESEMKVTPYKVGATGVKFDMVLGAIDTPKVFTFIITYRKALFKRESVQRFLSYFNDILCAVLDNKDVRLKDIAVAHELQQADADAYDTLQEDLDF